MVFNAVKFKLNANCYLVVAVYLLILPDYSYRMQRKVYVQTKKRIWIIYAGN